VPVDLLVPLQRSQPTNRDLNQFRLQASRTSVRPLPGPKKIDGCLLVQGAASRLRGMTLEPTQWAMLNDCHA